MKQEIITDHSKQMLIRALAMCKADCEIAIYTGDKEQPIVTPIRVRLFLESVRQNINLLEDGFAVEIVAGLLEAEEE